MKNKKVTFSADTPEQSLLDNEDIKNKISQFIPPETDLLESNKLTTKPIQISQTSTQMLTPTASSNNNYDIFYVDMINNYLEFYKKNNNKNQDYTMFDGIDTTDPTSTNHSLEQFYEQMCKYKADEVTNPKFIEIYTYEEMYKIKDNIDDELYGIFRNGFPIFVSLSFFSLLIELTNLKNEDTDDKIHYDIISLK